MSIFFWGENAGFSSFRIEICIFPERLLNQKEKKKLKNNEEKCKEK